MNHSDALYKRIYQKLLTEIEEGMYKDGQRLPTEKELSQKYYVSRITAQKAMRALADEGKIVRVIGKGSYIADSFQPDMELKRKKRRCIALIMGSLGASFGLNVVYGALDAAEKHGVDLILKNSKNDQMLEREIIKELESDACDGLIIQPANGELYSEEIIQAVFQGQSVVMVDRDMQGINVPFVGINNERMAYQALEKLIQLNHTRIALLATGNDKSSTIRERINGYTQAHMNYCISINPRYMLLNLCSFGQNQNTFEELKQITEKLKQFFKEYPEVTAVFATEYLVAKAAMDAINVLGLQEKVSIVSFDCDSLLGENAWIAHVLQPQYDMGKCAVDVMMRLLNKEPLEKRVWQLEGEWCDGASLFPTLQDNDVMEPE